MAKGFDTTQLITIGGGALAGTGIDFAGKYVDDLVYGAGLAPVEVYKRWPSMALSLVGGLALFALPMWKSFGKNIDLGMQVAGATAIATKLFSVIKGFTGASASSRMMRRTASVPMMNGRTAIPAAAARTNGTNDFMIIGRK